MNCNEKMVLLFNLFVLYVFLVSCSTNKIISWTNGFRASDDYKPANSNEPSAKVIMVVDGFSAYLFYQLDDPDPHKSGITNQHHRLPLEIQNFNIPVNEYFHGEILHSFNMKIETLNLDLFGYPRNFTNVGNTQCRIHIKFTPKPNANYIFYYNRYEKDKCRLQIKEAVLKNGVYDYVNITDEVTRAK